MVQQLIENKFVSKHIRPVPRLADSKLRPNFDDDFIRFLRHAAAICLTTDMSLILLLYQF